MQNTEINVSIKYLSQKIGNEIKEPFYATPGSAGMDLCAVLDEPYLLKAGERALISTGIALEIPENAAAFIYARSGLGIKHGICLANGVGVIDSDYRGEIKVGLINLGGEDYLINPGERIAQMVFSPVQKAVLTVKEDLEKTERGEGGFGSTGKS